MQKRASQNVEQLSLEIDFKEDGSFAEAALSNLHIFSSKTIYRPTYVRKNGMLFTENSFIFDGLQAVIVSQNENHYRFFQYRSEGNYNVSRPINSKLMISAENFQDHRAKFDYALRHIREIQEDDVLRQNINQFVYTCQQSIGAALDALAAGESNRARKINGDLFERYIRLLLRRIGIDVRDGVVFVPVMIDGEELFKMAYQHDLIVENGGEIRAIGSEKRRVKIGWTKSSWTNWSTIGSQMQRRRILQSF